MSRARQQLIEYTLAAVLTVGTATDAITDTVRVRKTILPFVTKTVITTKAEDATYSCWPAACGLSPFGDQPTFARTLAPALGGVTVGFASVYDSGTHPCNCWWSRTASARGTILFKTIDIPHQFAAATLVLDLTGSDLSDPSIPVPLMGIFETSETSQKPQFGGPEVKFDQISGQITVSQSFKQSDLFPDVPVGNLTFVPGAVVFPAPPYPNGAVLNEPSKFSYRIDVTTTAAKWVQSWPDRNQVPLRGFILVGTNESPPSKVNVQLAVGYHVTLEFDIDEPDR